MDSEQQAAAWWGDLEFELERTDRWEIGTLNLWIHRAQAEWKLAYEWIDGGGREQWRRESGVDFPEEGVASERFAVQQTGGIVHLRALTADRSVVARPRTPLRVPSGQRARIFVSSPLWIEVAVGPDRTFLKELSTRRLSKTWFGPNTRDGEVLYALKTGARTRGDDLPTRPYRFRTPIVIANEAEDTLMVERLNLPVSHLSVYENAGTLWSEEVTMLRTDSDDLAELDLRPGPPLEAEGARRLSGPREVSARGHLFRAFSSILGLGESSS
jgi:hypothetical protein